jgi:uncharacterized protein (DUF2235 family)
MPKNIVFCADGTWNSPGHDENHDQIPDPTNVCKLFLMLNGELSSETLNAADEQEKVLTAKGAVRQVAKYLHGVGDSRNPMIRMMGGAFGAGIITRIVRGYTFISRNYQPGDRIFLIGFSRGAYTVRALAGFIAKQGLLAPELARDRDQSYRRGAEAWYRYRKTVTKSNLVTSLAEIAADLPAFLSSKSLKDSDFVAVEQIGAVAVWDTVGALGIPLFAGDQRMDAFRFTDTKLSPAVSWGFHAVSLDEERCDFTPTLWSPRQQVRQVLFPGAHADVGGGYATVNNESDLSDLALEWMVEELKAVGVEFAAKPLPHFNPACGGIAHQPWRGSIYKCGLRSFPNELIGHHSIALRAKLPEVLADPAASPAPYRPKNMPKDICISGFNADAPTTTGICATCVLQD